jgi:hypothetical protein
MAGKLWIVGGLLIVLGSLTLEKKAYSYYNYCCHRDVPVVYSYRNLKN